jgi:hypothetical protein
MLLSMPTGCALCFAALFSAFDDSPGSSFFGVDRDFILGTQLSDELRLAVWLHSAW